MTLPPEVSPVARVRQTFERTVAAGWKPETTVGAAAEQVTTFLAAQGVSTLPAALGEVYRLIGHRPGLWLAGSDFGVTGTGRRLKAGAVSLVADSQIDANGILVLAGHGGYEYQFIPGDRIGETDPGVWVARETEDDEPDPVARQVWPTVTEWFRFQAGEVLRWRETLTPRGARVVREYFND